MADTSATDRLYVGIEVTPDNFTATWFAPGGSLTSEHTLVGYAALERRLEASAAAPGDTLVALAAAGDHWVGLAMTLHEAGYRVGVVTPHEVRHFSHSLPRRPATEAPVARDLAAMAAALRPARWTPPPALYQEVRQRLVARDALLNIRQQARNQHHALLAGPVTVCEARRHLNELIADLDRRITTLDDEIRAAVRAGEWSEAVAALTSTADTSLAAASGLPVGTPDGTPYNLPTATAATTGPGG
jgi:transposase